MPQNYSCFPNGDEFVRFNFEIPSIYELGWTKMKYFESPQRTNILELALILEVVWNRYDNVCISIV